MARKGSLGTMLRHRVALWRSVPSDTPDRLGQRALVDTEIAPALYAAVIPQTGSLLAGRTADTKLARTTHKVVIRWREDITPADWFVFRGQRYDILYVLDTDAARERLEVFCEVAL